MYGTNHLSWFGGGLNLGARGEDGIGIERKRGIRVEEKNGEEIERKGIGVSCLYLCLLTSILYYIILYLY